MNDKIDDPSSTAPGWFDGATAILLSLAGVMSAWSSGQNSLWDSDSLWHFNAAVGKQTEAARLDIEARQFLQFDAAMFVAWLDAYADDDVGRMSFYERRFRPELRGRFAAWRAQHPDLRSEYVAGAPAVALPDIVDPKERQALAMRDAAHTEFATGDKYNKISGKYLLVTIVLSIVLFLGGIGSMIGGRTARLLLLVVAAVIGLVAAAYMATLPVASFY